MAWFSHMILHLTSSTSLGFFEHHRKKIMIIPWLVAKEKVGEIWKNYFKESLITEKSGNREKKETPFITGSREKEDFRINSEKKGPFTLDIELGWMDNRWCGVGLAKKFFIRLENA